MALQLTAAGTSVACLIESIGFDEKIDDPATCSFTVPDSVGYALSQYQIVQVTDTLTNAILYSGFIMKVSDEAFPGNLGTKLRTVTCTDDRWRAEKRYWTGDEFIGWTAGDVAAELHRVVLSQEGVHASYALRHDKDATTFGQGTLTGVTAASGALALSAAGSDYTRTDAVTADFATGTLTQVAAVNNGLQLTSSLAIKFSGSVSSNLSNNNFYTWRKIWAGTPYTLLSGDELHYDVWIDSSSPEIKAAVELLFSDGTYIYTGGSDWQDQYAIQMQEYIDLKGWADDQWDKRISPAFGSGIGKTVVAAYLVFDGDKGGDYTAYFKNIKITNSGGSITRVSIFAGADTKMKANVPSSTNGYYNVKAAVTTVYEHDGVRLAPTRDITGVGIVKGSVISWASVVPTQPSGGTSQNYAPPILVESSIDSGATWQTCTNHASLPSLLNGMNTSGISVLIRQTLAVGGPDPELTPFLDSCTFTVYSAAAASKTDFTDIDQTQTQLGTGTLTNCTAYTDGVKTTGQYRNWDNNDYSSQNLFGTGTPVHGTALKAYTMRNDSGFEVKGQFSFAGTWANFIMECDIFLASDVGTSEFGLLYRTTAWNNTNNTYAYFAHITSTAIKLNRASNSTLDSFTVLVTVPLTLSAGNMYRMKVVANGSTHQIFLNDYMFINTTDSTYTAAGYVGVRMWNNSGVRTSTFFDNFGIIGYESDLISVSSRTTSALSLSGIVGDSRINWTADVPGSSNLVVESTLNNGTLWEACTNGGQIPQLVNGYNAAGKSLKIRFTMTNQAINLPIALQGLSVFVLGQYSASGSRVSPLLDTTPAGTIGASSVSWVASQPTGTSVAVDSSLDGTTFTALASSGIPVAGLTAQGVMQADDFATNTAANYSATFWTGGAAPVFTIDPTNSRMLVTSGTNGILLWTTFGTAKDVYMELIGDLCNAAGFVFRYTNVDNLYYVQYRDGSASANPNTVTIRKRTNGIDTQIVAPTALPAAFVRGTYHTLKVTMASVAITAYFDGVVVAQANDTSLALAGQVGILQNSSITSEWYSLRAQALGSDAQQTSSYVVRAFGGTLIGRYAAHGRTVYTRVRLTSTDPTVSPTVSSLVTSVRGPDIMTGALIPSTQYAYKKKISECIADVASQSKMYWRIDKSPRLIMRDRAYSPAPWPLYSADPTFLGTNNPPKLTRGSPAYRNRQFVTGAIDLQTIPESKRGDGTTQSWPLAYAIDSIVSLTLDGNPQTFGIQGQASGKNFYYQPGQNVLSADSALYPEDGALLAIVYVGRVPYTSMRENTAQQTVLAAIDNTTGIVEASEDCGGLSAASADALAQARIDEFAILSVDWAYSTSRGLLAPGHFQTIFVPEYGQVDLDVLITGIHTQIWADTNGTLNYLYDVSATSGPNLGTWERIFALAPT